MTSLEKVLGIEGIEMHLPPENGGQIVEVEYGLDPETGTVVEYWYDQNDREHRVTRYELDGAFEPWNGKPDLGGQIGEVCRIPAIAEARETYAAGAWFREHCDPGSATENSVHELATLDHRAAVERVKELRRALEPDEYPQLTPEWYLRYVEAVRAIVLSDWNE